MSSKLNCPNTIIRMQPNDRLEMKATEPTLVMCGDKAKGPYYSMDARLSPWQIPLNAAIIVNPNSTSIVGRQTVLLTCSSEKTT